MPSIVYFFFSVSGLGFLFLFMVRKYHVYSFIPWLFQASRSLRTARTDILLSLVILELHMRPGFMNVSTLCRHGREYDMFLLELGLKWSDSVVFLCSTIAGGKTLIQLDTACERVWLWKRGCLLPFRQVLFTANLPSALSILLTDHPTAPAPHLVAPVQGCRATKMVSFSLTFPTFRLR